MYNYWVLPNVLKVLKYYEKENFVELLPFTMAGPKLTIPQMMSQYLYKGRAWANYRHFELIARVDCYYRYELFQYDAVTCQQDL